MNCKSVYPTRRTQPSWTWGRIAARDFANFTPFWSGPTETTWDLADVEALFTQSERRAWITRSNA